VNTYRFEPFEESRDLERVLGWLLETKQAVGTEVDVSFEREEYFKAVRTIQSRNREFCSMLFMNNCRIGYVSAFPMKKHPDSAWLDFCYLVPEVRGTEASGLVADRINRMAADNGCEAIYLNVHRKNSRAVRFYEKNGWKLEKLNDNGLQRMKKTLA